MKGQKSHLCGDCMQVVPHARWAGHIARHGRLVPDAHARTLITDDDDDAGGGEDSE